ncbi:MAG: UvrB/UvrC motif-containing protein [Oscillospiraceae bacterium]|jgi:protein arginine kinase activator|nr:UvrB/UvrC motif-containing protein [Oscillospiraceae bacterium]
MMCDACNQNPATVRVVAFINGRRTERSLCTACMEKQKLQLRAEGMQSMLSAIWNSVQTAREKHPDLVCPECGLAYDEFLKTNRLGCAACYQAFRAQLTPLLKRQHGSTQHAGHVPERVEETIKAKTRAEQLRREMAFAVACEDFEQAAVLRDALRALAMAEEGGGRDA